MKHLKQYCEYIRNTGESVGLEQFDDDHAPIGPQLREDMERHDLFTIDPLGIFHLTEKGKALANG